MGVLQGAGTGAAIGSVIPGIGTAAGAIAGITSKSNRSPSKQYRSRYSTKNSTSSQRAGGETTSGSETTTGSLTAPQQIGSTQIGTPTGITTYNNQGSVNTANSMSFLSSIISNLMNAGSQASAKKYNSAEAAAERAFAKEMRGTAYQDTVKDMIAAGINPILAANNGATATPSGASASIGTQHYNQQSAQAAAVSAMYEYGNNTAELANRYLELAKKSTSAKQYHSAKSFNEAASSLAQSSAKQVSNYNYAANNLLSSLEYFSPFPHGTCSLSICK